jgi:hypothetical protein
VTDLCGKRQPGGIYRCDRPKRHEGTHCCSPNYNVPGKIVTWTNVKDASDRELRSSGLKRTRGPRAVSEKQQADIDVVTGIMAERVEERILASGYFWCECMIAGAGWECELASSDRQEVLDNWHPHHIEKRRKGAKANRHNVFRSRSRPGNIAIVTPQCHERLEHNAPEWSDAS